MGLRRVTMKSFSLFVFAGVFNIVRSTHFLETPRNTVALSHQQTAVLRCRTNNTDPSETVEWSEYQSSSTGTTISIDNKIKHPSGTNKYGIVNKYDLQIKNVRPSDSGRYKCKFIRAVKEKFVYVIVLDSKPRCSTSNIHHVVAEGDSFSLICQVTYHGAWGANMQWIDPSGSKRNTTDVSSLKKSKFVSNVLAKADDNGKNFTCNLAFRTPPIDKILSKDYDKRNPRFTSHCGVTLNVHFGPRDVSIRQPKRVYKVGDRLSCHAKGNPYVSYRWERVSGSGEGFPVEGAELTVTARMAGVSVIRCVASNQVRGDLRMVKADFTLRVCGSKNRASPSSAASISVYLCMMLSLSTLTSAKLFL